MTRSDKVALGLVLTFGAPCLSSAQERATVNVSDGAVTITVNEARPLLRIVREISALCQCPITYEDAPLINTADVRDVTSPSYRGTQRALDPRGGPLTVSYPATASLTRTDSVGFVQAAISAYRNAGYPGDFTSREEDDFIHIVPQLMLDERGRQRKLSSVLDVPISLPAGDRLITVAIREVLAAVTKVTGRPILEGPQPSNLFQSATVDAFADNEPARLVLQRVLEPWRGRLSWQLLYDPGSRNYMLSILVVQRKTP